MTVNQENSTINPFLLLSDSQWRFVTAMIEHPTFSKAEAARHIGLKPQSVYIWPDHVDQAVELARRDIHGAALQARKTALLKAVQVKLRGLDNKDPRIAQDVATEIIEWELGKANQPLSGPGKDGAILIKVEGLIDDGDSDPDDPH